MAPPDAAPDAREGLMHRSVTAARHEATDEFESVPLVHSFGCVRRVMGMLVEADLAEAAIGEQCEIFPRDAPERSALCEVVGFNDRSVLLSPLCSLEGVSTSHLVRRLNRVHRIRVGPSVLGRLFDGFGLPLDGGPMPDDHGTTPRQVMVAAPLPGDRPPVTEVFRTGVRSVDGLLTLGVGQRIGVFAGPGCGKTTLLAAMARGAEVDAVVLALIGERGREVREFTERELDPATRARTAIVCATSDRTAIERVRAAFTATAMAEGLCEQGASVLLVVDSLTRLARAQREIGLAAGEPPARAGLPPSVYSLLPRLTERAGRTRTGAVTALYSVLVEGDLRGDPVAEEAVSLLDGHIILSRKLAEQGVYPAVDVLPSISRLMSHLVDTAHLRGARRLRSVLSRYQEVELLVRLGEYQRGVDAELDTVVDDHPKVLEFLRQDTRQSAPWNDTMARLAALARQSAS